MFLAIGARGHTAGVFHMATHARSSRRPCSSRPVRSSRPSGTSRTWSAWAGS